MKKRLYRSKTDKKLCGVCSGVADFFGIDPNFLRVILALLAFFFVTAIGFLHLFGYLGLSPDAGNAVRIKKDHSADDASGAAGRGTAPGR